MIRLLINTAIFLASSAVGLLVAALVLDDMSIDFGSFIIVVVIFSIIQAVLSPFLLKTVNRNAPALLGGVGLLSTYVALLVTSLISSGLIINGLSTWVFTCLIVWLATMLATLLIPLIFVKKVVQERRPTSGTMR